MSSTPFALKVAQLSIVTMGWIVLLQVGLLAIDKTRFGLELNRTQWAAVAGILLLQCYLIVSTGSSSKDAEPRAVPREKAPSVPSPSVPEPRAALSSVTATAAPAEPDTPYLTVDLDTVAERYEQLHAALPGIALHYAAKANPAPEVLAVLVAQGASFDVASPAEITACLAAGARASALSYGNTAKKERDIAFAFLPRCPGLHLRQCRRARQAESGRAGRDLVLPDRHVRVRIETSRDGDPTGLVVLAGPTCDSVDVLYRDAGYRLPLTPAAGDRVRLLATGAYTASYSSVGFNGLPPLSVHCMPRADCRASA